MCGGGGYDYIGNMGEDMKTSKILEGKGGGAVSTQKLSDVGGRYKEAEHVCECVCWGGD